MYHKRNNCGTKVNNKQWILNSSGGEGAEVVYALRNEDTLAKGILDAIGDAGQIKRSYYQRRLPEDPSKDYYYIQRLTGNTEPVLIEYGFIDNKNDLYKLQNNLLDYGEAVVKAVTNYIGVPYTKPSQTPDNNIYIVKKGDSLYSIASKYGITVNELKAANNLTSNLLNVGQTLIIPTSLPDTSVPGEYTVYTVKNGDTLYRIASEFGISVNDIIDFNQLTSTGLIIGQQLLIPNKSGSTSETVIYTIMPGDSLWKISQLCNITVDEIVRLNNLSTTVIQPGDTLKLPGTCNFEGNGNDNNNNNNNNDNDNTNGNEIKHVVTNNETLYSIARKYGTTVNDIMNINNLTSNLLTIGQILLIPNTSGYINYYVQPNDSLYSIARKYNTTVDAIKRLNNLTSDLLTINQLLLIPS